MYSRGTLRADGSTKCIKNTADEKVFIMKSETAREAWPYIFVDVFF